MQTDLYVLESGANLILDRFYYNKKISKISVCLANFSSVFPNIVSFKFLSNIIRNKDAIDFTFNLNNGLDVNVMLGKEIVLFEGCSYLDRLEFRALSNINQKFEFLIKISYAFE